LVRVTRKRKWTSSSQHDNGSCAGETGSSAFSIESLERLRAAKDCWKGMQGQCSPAQEHIWAVTYAESFRHFEKPRVLCLAASGQVRALAPMASAAQGSSRLELLGTRAIQMHSDLIYENEAALEMLTHTLAHLRVPLLLRRVPRSSPTVAAIDRAFRRRGLVLARPMEGSPYIGLDESWTEPESHFGKKRRAEIRRARRVAEKMGRVRFEVVAPDPAGVAAAVEEAFRVEASGWKGRLGTAMAKDQDRGDFHRRYALAAAREGLLRLLFLRIDGQAAAMEYAVEWKNKLWSLKSGYDEQFRTCSPGTLLQLETVRYAASMQLESYELLGVLEPYKRVWTLTLHPLVSILAYPSNPSGLFALAGDAVRYARRRKPSNADSATSSK
jgi:CelD/BcsL family acetyltransferase involved in cellulose biosynthesis